MKYLIIVPDGAGDEPIPELGGKTPLEYAYTPVIDSLAAKGEVGTVSNVPEGLVPGSDAANLSVLGYDPRIYLTGRSPLEAASMGIRMEDEDAAFRANLVTLEGKGRYEDLIIKDHSSGEISTEEAGELIKAINKAFASDKLRFYTGVSYRHCIIVHGCGAHFQLTPPHDALGRRVGDYLPRGVGSGFLTDMMKKSYGILKNHPVNTARAARGLNTADSLWIWGQGSKPGLYSFYEKRKLTGSVISAVDLIKGIGICAGLDSVDVKGATGTICTNYKGKADAAIAEFRKGKDLVFVHFEGPDECSHQGDVKGKIKCLEDIDKKTLEPVVDALRFAGEDFRILEVPDHRTPITLRTHSAIPVPFVIYDSTKEYAADSSRQFNERSGKRGKYYPSGCDLADRFLGQV